MQHIGDAPRRGFEVDGKVCGACLENGGNGHKKLFFTVKSHRNKFIRLYFLVFDESRSQLIGEAVKFFIGEASVLIRHRDMTGVFLHLFLKKVQPGKGRIILQFRSL